MLFADDTNILVSGENLHTVQHKLTNIVSELQLWFSSNNFVVNTDIMSVISFHTPQDKNPIRPHVTLEHNIIPYNTTAKFLGIHIIENVKWNKHIKQIRSKLHTSYYMITSLQKIMNPHILRTTYFGCFRTHLRYGLILWGGDPESIKVFRIQKVIRVLGKFGCQVSCRNLFRDLNIFYYRVCI